LRDFTEGLERAPDAQPRVTCADTQRHRPSARHQMSV
jgi:hypothetical protein